jgi:hypothetical protein
MAEGPGMSELPQQQAVGWLVRQRPQQIVNLSAYRIGLALLA